jgi:hypothetical protein
MTTLLEPCIYCGESTAMGDGKFVNRIPADDGWACADCAGYECDECHENIYLDCEVRVDYEKDGKYHYGNYHEDCYNEEKHGKKEY